MVPIAETAKEMGGSSLRDFIVKQLNMWIQWTNDVYLKDMELWQNGATKKTLEDFRGQKCYVGLDLSAGGDLTSLAIVFPFLKDDVRKYFVHAHSLDLCQYFEHKKLKGYADFFNSSSSFCCGVI